MRHAHASYDARSADRARADAYFNRVGSRVCDIFYAGGVCDVSDHYVDVKISLQLLKRVDNAFGVSVRRVHHKRIYACFNESFGSLQMTYANRRGDAKASEFVFISAWIFDTLFKVFNCNKPL